MTVYFSDSNWIVLNCVLLTNEFTSLNTWNAKWSKTSLNLYVFSLRHKVNCWDNISYLYILFIYSISILFFIFEAGSYFVAPAGL